MRKLGVEEWLVSAVMSMYIGAKTVFRTVYGNSKGFEVKVGMHQGSLLFVIVMEAISREFRVALPWELLYADDLAVIAETEEDHMQVCTSLQTDNHASTPPHSFLQARCPSCCPANSVESTEGNLSSNVNS